MIFYIRYLVRLEMNNNVSCCFSFGVSVRFPALKCILRSLIVLFCQNLLSFLWGKNKVFQVLELLTMLPLVVDRCICTFLFRSLPKVWMAVKMPGTTLWFWARVLTDSAAKALISFSKNLLSQNKSQSSEGIVKVMCCQEVSGKMLFCLKIQSSIFFCRKSCRYETYKYVELFFEFTI